MATTNTAAKHSDFARDFSPAVRRSLLKQGILVIGICTIPAATGEMRMVNGERGYELSNQGTFMIRTRREVAEMGGGK